MSARSFFAATASKRSSATARSDRFGLTLYFVLWKQGCQSFRQSALVCYNQPQVQSGSSGERSSAMKTKAEILKILQKEKPELVGRYGLKRLALFGSYARETQREDSDVDVLVEIEPQIGLGFVDLADRIESVLGVRTEVVSRRAIKPRYWEIIQRELRSEERRVGK